MVMMAAVEAVTLTPEQLRVASLDSRRLADQLATILDRITGDLSHTEEDIDDSDKVENILLQLEINQLEQELSRLTLATATTAAPSTSTTTTTTTTTTTVTTRSHNSSQSPARGKAASSGKAASPVKLIKSAKPAKLSRSKLNRKKFRKMLEQFYHGNHFKI